MTIAHRIDGALCVATIRFGGVKDRLVRHGRRGPIDFVAAEATRLGKLEVRSVEDLMFVLMQAKPGQTVTAVVLREGKPVSLEATFQEGRRR